MKSEQPEALRLANYCEELAKEIDHSHFTHDLLDAAAELRRLHAENEALRAQIDGRKAA